MNLNGGIAYLLSCPVPPMGRPVGEIVYWRREDAERARARKQAAHGIPFEIVTVKMERVSVTYQPREMQA